MRAVYFKRTFVSYICTVGLFSLLLTLYVWGLKQHKQTGVKFNLKNPKFKRDVYGGKTLTQTRLNKENVQNKHGSVGSSYKSRSRLDKGMDVRPRSEPNGQNVKPGPRGKAESVEDFIDKLEQRKRHDSDAGKDSRLNVYVVEEHHEGMYSYQLHKYIYHNYYPKYYHYYYYYNPIFTTIFLTFIYMAYP